MSDDHAVIRLEDVTLFVDERNRRVVVAPRRGETPAACAVLSYAQFEAAVLLAAAKQPGKEPKS